MKYQGWTCTRNMRRSQCGMTWARRRSSCELMIAYLRLKPVVLVNSSRILCLPSLSSLRHLWAASLARALFSPIVNPTLFLPPVIVTGEVFSGLEFSMRQTSSLGQNLDEATRWLAAGLEPLYD